MVPDLGGWALSRDGLSELSLHFRKPHRNHPLAIEDIWAEHVDQHMPPCLASCRSFPEKHCFLLLISSPDPQLSLSLSTFKIRKWVKYCLKDAVWGRPSPQVCIVATWLGATSIHISVTFLLPLGFEDSSFFYLKDSHSVNSFIQRNILVPLNYFHRRNSLKGDHLLSCFLSSHN